METTEVQETITELIINEPTVLSMINDHLINFFNTNSNLEHLYAEVLVTYLKIKYDNMNKDEILEAVTQWSEQNVI